MHPPSSIANLRYALPEDCPAIEALIAVSARALGRSDYTARQIEGALLEAFGVDTQLIEDRTYFLALADGRLAGCGGWSFRQTLFGGDRARNRSAARIDPENGAAKIRAFFVHPDFARQGIATAILRRCERAARERGYRRAELMSTLTGLPFYERHGYLAGPPIEYPLTEGLTIRFVPMSRELGCHAA